jgi:replicative DNA helicase|tara:strand:- start:2225 stop:3532 length:1308 start_codon:yes stop_codon:yes gene_type:complete
MSTPPPQSFEAEQEVLATCLISPENMPWLSTQLLVTDFWVGQHQVLWSLFTECQEKHGTVDLVLLQQLAKDSGRWEPCGGTRVMAQIMDRAGLSAHADRYVAILKDKALQRRVLDAAYSLDVVARDDDLDADSRLASVDAAIRQVFEGTAAQGLRHGGTGVKEHDAIVSAASDGRAPDGLKTGLWHMDEQIGGLMPGWHVLVMAASGVGKSAFACSNLALEAAKQGKTVAIYSLEMTRAQVMGRMIAAESGVPYHIQTRGRMSDEDRDRYAMALPAVCNLPLYIDEGEGLTLDSLSSRTRALAYEKGGLGMIVLDYIQLMEADGNAKAWRSNRTEEISKITRTLKKLAKELKCVVVTLSQPTAEGARSGRDLSLADAKGAQSIGADVDMAVILNKRDDGAVRLDVAKFRHGPPFRLTNGEIRWNGARMRFEDSPL